MAGVRWQEEWLQCPPIRLADGVAVLPNERRRLRFGRFNPGGCRPVNEIGMAASQWAESTLVRPGRLDAGDVCGQEVDAVSVEVASGAVVVLGGAGAGVTGEDLGVAQGNAGVQGVGDRGYLPSIMKNPWPQPVSVCEARKACKAKRQQ